MVFSSLEFIFLFLPITLFLYYICIYYKKTQLALASLFIASLFYYAYWNPSNIWIIIASILWNFSFGLLLKQKNSILRKILFFIGLLGNITALAYFKYTDFAIETVNTLAHTHFSLTHILLPIGISFFTFQQIAYLVDIYKNKDTHSLSTNISSLKETFLDYCLFVCFFPQLVAGPIVHHSEMMPQFANKENQTLNWQNIYWGLVLLSIGLAKKVIIADNISPFVVYTFDTAASLSFVEALLASLAYTIQLYFDFSGYSDMAVGIALFFNIKLPFNFYSPYKAQNIQDFWRRWHITLSRWLKEYIYIPLGGNKKGENRTLINLFLTFLIGGIWHGAAWTFVIWGSLHGLAIVIHRYWTKSGKQFFRFKERTYFTLRLPFKSRKKVFILKNIVNFPAMLTTFLFINFTWIFFRATSFERVQVFFDAFSLQNGFNMRHGFYEYTHVRGAWVVMILGLLLAFFAKNTQEIYTKHTPSLGLTLYKSTLFIASIAWTIYLFTMLANPQGEFIYFQF